MKRKTSSISEVIEAAAEALRKDLNRSEGTIKYYRIHWRKVERFMESTGITRFDSQICKDYLLTRFGQRDYFDLPKTEKDVVSAVTVLIEFYESGSILSKKEQVRFEGSIGKLIESYLANLTSRRLKASTIYEKARHLCRFQKYLKASGIRSIGVVKLTHALTFLIKIDRQYRTVQHHTIQSLRGFFSHLYIQGIIDVDLGSRLPRDKFNKQPELPSVYTEKEINKMIASIDRSTKVGKRNYAIVLLAARLGLRSSDIAGIKFTDIDWDNCVIRMNQFKTGKLLELPLFAEIGEAIIDYLKYGRAESTSPKLFLLARNPFTAVVGNAIGGIVRSCYIHAGVNISNRKSGSHTLRHSLAGILLSKGTALPVITEVLGHENSESTRYYLRIDLESMAKCALEVPQVSESFYHQKAQYFYA